MSAPDPDLSPAAASLIDTVREYAQRHPAASRRGLVLLLARKYCKDMLRRRWRRD